MIENRGNSSPARSRLPLARWADAAGIAGFVVLTGLLCRVVWLNPYYNWDSLPYTALVESKSSDPVALHAAAYGAIDAEAPRSISQEFHSPERYPNYRGDMATNPWHFAEQLPLYSVKPFYILILAAMHRAGWSALKAARLTSLVSFALLGAVLFLWLRRYAGTWLAAVATCFLLSTAEFLGTGAETTPDALFAGLAFLGLYLAFAEYKPFPALCALVLLPLIRSDGLVVIGLVIVYLVWKSPGFRVRHGVVILAIEGLVYLFVGRLGGGYSYEKLLYHSFVERQLAPAETTVRLTAAQYFHALYIFILGTLATPRPIYFLLGLTSLKARVGLDSLRHLAWLGLVFTLVHILAFPLPDSRFLILPFAIFILWAAGALTNGKPGNLLPWPMK